VFQYSATYSLASLTVSAVFAVLVYTAIEVSLGALTLVVRRVVKAGEVVRTAILIDVVSVLLYAPIITLLAYAYLEAPPWTLLLLIAPAFAAQRLFVLYREQSETSRKLTEAICRLERVNISFATALVTALDARDHYTAGHSAAVAVYSRDIAKAMGLAEHEQKSAHLCGLLHDIGKIGVPTGVLEKRRALTKSERTAIEAHAEIGATILERIEGYEEIALAVRHHHERYDGFGYPCGKRERSTPILARVVAVADAYSAMTSIRPYRLAMTGEEAIIKIEKEKARQFDPNVVEAFVKVLECATKEYVSGTDRDFELEVGDLALEVPEPSVVF
jgi:putative nucleotidyltransferase with HDIG domain